MPEPKHFLSRVAPVRDEEAYLVAFVDYYLIQGVDHFYFYDNESRIPLDDVLRDYRDKCTVLTALGDAVQSRAFTHFARRFRHDTTWRSSTSTSSCCRIAMRRSAISCSITRTATASASTE